MSKVGNKLSSRFVQTTSQSVLDKLVQSFAKKVAKVRRVEHQTLGLNALKEWEKR